MQRVVSAGGLKGSMSLQRSPADGSGKGSGANPAPSGQPSPKAPSLPIVTIPEHIRGSSTPPEMKNDRIPPRRDVSVNVEIKGTPDPSAPVILSVEGQGSGHGSVTIDGQGTSELFATGTVAVKLQGTAQTEPGKAGFLRLTATQGAKQLASSNGFSVSANPQDMEFTFDRLVKGHIRGIRVLYNWQSDSYDKSDLDQAPHSERVQHHASGCLSKLDPITSCYTGSTKRDEDEHAILVDGLKCKGKDKVFQTFMFRDDRTGAKDIPFKNSGFIIEHIVQQKSDKAFEVVTSKKGEDATAKDPNPKCKSGPIFSKAGGGSVTKTQDI